MHVSIYHLVTGDFHLTSAQGIQKSTNHLLLFIYLFIFLPSGGASYFALKLGIIYSYELMPNPTVAVLLKAGTS